MTTKQMPQYVAELRDRFGEHDLHLEFLAGPGERACQRWAEQVMVGIRAALGRSADLVEIVISYDRAPIYGAACEVGDAIAASVANLRQLEAVLGEVA